MARRLRAPFLPGATTWTGSHRWEGGKILNVERSAMMKLELPELPYAHDALEPHMSGETLEYHHGKHHKGYVDTANELLKDSTVEAESLEELIKNAHGSAHTLFNNAAQHYNHQLFWQCMKPKGGGSLPDSLQRAIIDRFSLVSAFKEKFVSEGKAQFGSGWVWLVILDGNLEVMSTPNGENPLIHDAKPVLACDVWEHSYYLDHRNDRGAYLETFVSHLINWEFVADRYERELGT